MTATTASTPAIFTESDTADGQPEDYILVQLTHDDGDFKYIEVSTDKRHRPGWDLFADTILDGIENLWGRAMDPMLRMLDWPVLREELDTEGTSRFPMQQVSLSVLTESDIESVRITVSGHGGKQAARITIDPRTGEPIIDNFVSDWLARAVEHLDPRLSGEAQNILAGLDWAEVLDMIRIGGTVEVYRADGPILVTLSAAS